MSRTVNGSPDEIAWSGQTKRSRLLVCRRYN